MLEKLYCLQFNKTKLSNIASFPIDFPKARGYIWLYKILVVGVPFALLKYLFIYLNLHQLNQIHNIYNYINAFVSKYRCTQNLEYANIESTVTFLQAVHFVFLCKVLTEAFMIFKQVSETIRWKLFYTVI